VLGTGNEIAEVTSLTAEVTSFTVLNTSPSMMPASDCTCSSTVVDVRQKPSVKDIKDGNEKACIYTMCLPVIFVWLAP
jgi:hypothetical protein